MGAGEFATAKAKEVVPRAKAAANYWATGQKRGSVVSKKGEISC